MFKLALFFSIALSSAALADEEVITEDHQFFAFLTNTIWTEEALTDQLTSFGLDKMTDPNFDATEQAHIELIDPTGFDVFFERLPFSLETLLIGCSNWNAASLEYGRKKRETTDQSLPDPLFEEAYSQLPDLGWRRQSCGVARFTTSEGPTVLEQLSLEYGTVRIGSFTRQADLSPYSSIRVTVNEEAKISGEVWAMGVYRASFGGSIDMTVVTTLRDIPPPPSS